MERKYATTKHPFLSSEERYLRIKGLGEDLSVVLGEVIEAVDPEMKNALTPEAVEELFREPQEPTER